METAQVGRQLQHLSASDSAMGCTWPCVWGSWGVEPEVRGGAELRLQAERQGPWDGAQGTVYQESEERSQVPK